MPGLEAFMTVFCPVNRRPPRGQFSPDLLVWHDSFEVSVPEPLSGLIGGVVLALAGGPGRGSLGPVVGVSSQVGFRSVWSFWLFFFSRSNQLWYQFCEFSSPFFGDLSSKPFLVLIAVLVESVTLRQGHNSQGVCCRQPTWVIFQAAPTYPPGGVQVGSSG